jgi:hypothetical protein
VVRPIHLLGLGAATGLLLCPAIASADTALNPALSRLVLDHRCNAAGVGGNGNDEAYMQSGVTEVGRYQDQGTIPGQGTYLDTTGRSSCAPNHVAFKQLMAQWGFALAPAAMHTARTTGFGGFHFSLEAMYTKIDNDSSYWKLGTQGPRDPTSNKASIFNSSPPSMIQMYSIRVRKSFGFGLELATQVGYVPSSTILSGGADVRMALLEGFRTGFLGILPDVAVGGGVRTITGTPEFQLTTVGLDVQLSKPIALASQSVLSPWIGYQYLWIFGDSGLIDTTPATDPVGYCQFTGTNVPGNPDPQPMKNPMGGDHVYDGQPVCAGTNGGRNSSPLDFNNNVVFNNARLERQRGMVGLSYRYEMVALGMAFITDLVDPADAQVGNDVMDMPTGNGPPKPVTDADAMKGVKRQWSLVFEVGAMF